MLLFHPLCLSLDEQFLLFPPLLIYTSGKALLIEHWDPKATWNFDEMCSHGGWEDSTFHLKVPLQLKLGHFSQSVHVAETATHAFCLALLAGKNEILLQQRPSTFPLIRCLQQMCWVHICLLWTWSFMETVTKRPLRHSGTSCYCSAPNRSRDRDLHHPNPTYK